MKVFCVLSDARAFVSKSPVMHNAVFKKLGFNGVYTPFQVRPEHVGGAVSGLRALNIAGANVTVPYKEAVIPYLDDLSEQARSIGAVNTIVFNEDKLTGHNTDADGFIDALEQTCVKLAGKSAFVFGTGGAAKAAIAGLKQLSLNSITVAGRDKAAVEKLSALFDVRPASIGPAMDDLHFTNIVVNATSVSSPAESPEFAALALELKLPRCELLFDLNYGRNDNFWRSLAVKHNALFLDGIPMLAYQAWRSFKIWTGMDIEPSMYLQALKESL